MKILLTDLQTGKELPFTLEIEQHAIHLLPYEDPNNWSREYDNSIHLYLIDGKLVFEGRSWSTQENIHRVVVDIFKAPKNTD